VLISRDQWARSGSLYRGITALRLSGPPGSAALAAALLGALGLGGCSYALESMSSKSELEAKATNSAAQPADDRAGRPAAAAPEEADLAYARAAAADALGHGAKANSVPWQNPQTGVSGNITPLATTYSEGGLPCRDFLASYVRGSAQSWLQGSACRTARGEWEVKSLKPLKSS
jgi:surface antigen